MKRDIIRNYGMTITGIAIMAFTIANFYMGSGISLGGSTGLSLIIQHFMDIDPSLTVLFTNILLLILGALIVGKGFTIATLFGSLLYPAFLAFFERHEIYFGNSLTHIILGAILMGIACALIVRSGASTGGSDALGMILHKQFNINVSTIMLVTDLSILLASFTYMNVQMILWSIFALLIQISTMRLSSKALSQFLD